MADRLPPPSFPSERAASLTADELRRTLDDGGELALLDVRDHGVYARGHLLLASSAPFWRLELDIHALVPRPATRIVVLADDALAEQAAHKLGRLGYSDVRVLEGGNAAWTAAGGHLFSGTNVLGKAFGEIIEHDLGTPYIDAAELKRRLDRQDKLVVIDSRTTEEFQAFSLDGAHSLPGAEIVYRISQVVPDDQTPIIVNCAGRTRSIVGAQTLINAGIPNPVLSLKDGTMAWLMNGDTLRHGARQAIAAPRGQALALAQARAARVAERAGVRAIDATTLARLEARQDRSLFRFDIRHRTEYLAGHLPGWRWAPGGQLVQASDEYIGVRNAEVVLADWDGVRAQTTAAWLAQLGWTVYTYAPGQLAQLETGPEPRTLGNAYRSATPWVSPDQARQWQADHETLLIDIEDSIAHARQHVAGARFVAPSRLRAYLDAHASGRRVILVSADGILAASAARELGWQGLDDIHALQGGTAQWVALDLPTAAGKSDILTGDDDTWHGPYVFDTLEQRNAKFNDYLQWEVELAPRLAQEPGLAISLKASVSSRATARPA
ncbi:MAG: Thiosulfate sulfurtransferase GlpE [Paracidovorax wautersii]|uniref:Thiosulfate sulfurtransferase GlpE n=1 Tax=Paracidovorax wautersii TaxID=1177982 RepID=A0A7V8FN05_9BURK|nr:MAG: Thiosulfate sulfurtransferase GlpE [Paracidovorax wautersii]